MPGKRRDHYRGDYDRRARSIRAAANADPSTRCWRCGRTLAEHKPGDTWDAGHIRDGDPTSPLAPEAASCNRSSGAIDGNRRRQGLKPTRQW